MSSNLKILIVFYSRTGTTKKLAEEISKCIENCEVEEIFDTQKREGTAGYLASGKDAVLKKKARIKETKKNPADFDLVIIGTPVWVLTMSSPIRTYIIKNKNRFKRIALFCTMGSMGEDNTFMDMEKLCDKKAMATCAIKTGEVVNNDFADEIRDFIDEIVKKILI
jgi:flavodoxin